ncbi:Exosome complex component RRP4 [Coelomomyces lativittatus]|nr:Exosome complex component RRP4 [Coelomomyces lativittatus]
MRHYYAEGDIVISEIHQTTHDDTLMLHTRFHHPLGQSTSTSTSTSSSSSSSSSSSFSMPTSFHPDPFKHHEGTSKKTTMFGTYCWIPHTLIPRLKSQFLFLKYTSVPIQVVLGRNGGIWMMPTPTTTDLPSHHEEKDLRMMKKRPPVPSFEKEVYLILARLHHCFLLFMKMNSWVNEKKLKYFYLATLPYPVHELNQSDVLMKVFRDANEKMREMEEGEGGGDEDSAAVMGR